MSEIYLAKNIRFLLDKEGASLSWLSRRIGVSRKTMQNWTAGAAPANVLQAKALAEHFGLTVDELLFERLWLSEWRGRLRRTPIARS